MKLTTNECPVCAHEKPIELFICKDCADGISGYTDLLRRVREAREDMRELSNKDRILASDEYVNGWIECAEEFLYILGDKVPELEDK